MSTRLTEKEIEAIDRALLSNASDQYRKIARIVGTVMGSPLHKPGIPDLFYAERLRHLVATGQLESKDDLNSMRFAEVRLRAAKLKELPSLQRRGGSRFG